jgi:hypothetical protein
VYSIIRTKESHTTFVQEHKQSSKSMDGKMGDEYLKLDFSPFSLKRMKIRLRAVSGAIKNKSSFHENLGGD